MVIVSQKMTGNLDGFDANSFKTSQMNTDNYGSHEASQIQVSYKKSFG